MSREQEDAQPTDEGKEALSALRGIWKAQGQSSADLDEACGNTKACKSMESVGFQGLADDPETAATANTAVGNDLRAAWKTKLEREGKLSSEAGSVRDLVFGSSEQKE
ncbi:MAG TPA: hypothetical protein VJT72_11335 [Pseudonocardiaceae bacterium]|nr:hypothetical protein [Pseudonocardiaceae bacterium]